MANLLPIEGKRLDNLDLDLLMFKTVRYCEEKALSFLLGYDANVHNEICGSSETNQREEKYTM